MAVPVFSSLENISTRLPQYLTEDGKVQWNVGVKPFLDNLILYENQYNTAINPMSPNPELANSSLRFLKDTGGGSADRIAQVYMLIVEKIKEVHFSRSWFGPNWKDILNAIKVCIIDLSNKYRHIKPLPVPPAGTASSAAATPAASSAAATAAVAAAAARKAELMAELKKKPVASMTEEEMGLYLANNNLTAPQNVGRPKGQGGRRSRRKSKRKAKKSRRHRK
jgi:hypothetical protein